MSCSAILTAFAQQVSRPKTPPTETIDKNPIRISWGGTHKFEVTKEHAYNGQKRVDTSTYLVVPAEGTYFCNRVGCNTDGYYTLVNLESDILGVAALANAYATCHNVQDLLYFRGFSSKPAHVKRGKKGPKSKTKKKGGS